MTNSEQARDFIENSLNGLEKSIIKRDNIAVNKSQARIYMLISEYKKVIGIKDTNSYTQNYAEIIKNGGYLK